MFVLKLNLFNLKILQVYKSNMNKNRTLFKLSNTIKRFYASSAKIKVETSEEVLKNIENKTYKPRTHPGINKLIAVQLPEKIISAIDNVTEDYPLKTLLKDSEAMCHHLKGRVPPMESDRVQDLKNRVYETILQKELSKDGSEELVDSAQFKQRVKDKVIDILKKKVYNWSPMTYDLYNSLVYLLGRSPAEYAVLVKIFLEIQSRDPMFKPRSLFDFGSGVGTATWAANLYWKSHLYEYFNVDTSSFMNDLAMLLLKGGRGTKQMDIKGVFYRQFLPANNTTYDLVVSAYSLLELPSLHLRMEAILKLWNKTENYLIVVEQGTNAGFKVINEVRDYIIQLNDANQGHVFSPCPHEHPCPRFLQDDTPCNFIVSYITPPYYPKQEMHKELYSYVVLKKGPKLDDSQWPRVVRETLVRSRHSICRMCTAEGQLQEVVFTASKHGKATYHCARSTKWGDRLPITLKKENMSDGNIIEDNTENYSQDGKDSAKNIKSNTMKNDDER